jgi:hypothetical protein
MTHQGFLDLGDALNISQRNLPEIGNLPGISVFESSSNDKTGKIARHGTG